VNGTTLTVREWAQRCGVHESTLYREARRGALETAIADRLARRRTRSVEDQRVKRHRRAIADVAAVLGLTREAVRKRLRRVGSLERVIALGPKCPGLTGRRPVRGRSLDVIAAVVGISRQGLHKAAKRAGHTIDDEIALRQAKKASAA
jgi:DNA-binding phage protein